MYLLTKQISSLLTLNRKTTPRPIFLQSVRYARDYKIVLTKVSQILKHTTGGDLTKYSLRFVSSDHPNYHKPPEKGQIGYKMVPKEIRNFAKENSFKLTDSIVKGMIAEKAGKAVLLDQGYQTVLINEKPVGLLAAINSPGFNHPCAAGSGLVADVNAMRFEYGGMSCNEDQMGEGKTTVAHLEVKNYLSTFERGAAQAQKIQTKAADGNKWVDSTESGTSTEMAKGGYTVITQSTKSSLVTIPEGNPPLEPEQFYLSTNFDSDMVLEIDKESQETKKQLIEDILEID